MNHYRFEAAKQDGEIVHGVLAAPHVPAAWDDVGARQLRPLSVLEIPAERTRRLPRRELAFFFHDLAAQLRAGVPLERALPAAEAGSRLDGCLDAALEEAARQLERAAERAGERRKGVVVAGILLVLLGVAVGVGLVTARHDAGSEWVHHAEASALSPAGREDAPRRAAGD